ncbi:hypothetical protein NLG97_g4915 [Lecanicillium saksenae]|uniref:Uncharacterized protein n=1 Tax=Lecanicillium saksenae TaxID=468837 RepID=A0ACC1QX47_9HYPO|nr:hypothetical protein NLG97_g4915 [Lecanicillium saksenae]
MYFDEGSRGSSNAADESHDVDIDNASGGLTFVVAATGCISSMNFAVRVCQSGRSITITDHGSCVADNGMSIISDDRAAVDHGSGDEDVSSAAILAHHYAATRTGNTVPAKVISPKWLCLGADVGAGASSLAPSA